MVDPSPTPAGDRQEEVPATGAMTDEKQRLRERLRGERRRHVESLPASIRALVFHRPPAPVAALVADGATVGLYHAARFEAPTAAYARWFAEHGHAVALPWFEHREAPMQFRIWADPIGDTGLESGPFGPQPSARSPMALPDIAFVPLIGFTGDGQRLGQGGGHFDRWLGAHPKCVPIGLAWDCQLAETLPREDHDISLHAVITPTRVWQGAR